MLGAGAEKVCAWPC